MKFNKTITKTLLVAAVASATLSAGVQAKTFKWAFQGDIQSLDPYTLNETFTLGFLGNVYEGLTAYDKDFNVVPSLAVSWENTSPTKWVFKLREGVKFHNGNVFNADDVVFSWKRSLSDGSDMKSYGTKISNIVIVDDYTIELETPVPNPILPRTLTFYYMMDKEWSEANNASKSSNAADGASDANYANTHANGTGPYVLKERQPDVKTVFSRNTNYWTELDSNVTTVEFTPISQASTRIAALISGELDLVYPIPVQDWNRLDNTDGVHTLNGPEARTIFLGMDQYRDELLYSNVKGKNPFKDIRVRQAFASAINLDAINKKIMRGSAKPTGILIAPQVNGYNAEIAEPYVYNPKKSKELLQEAGYANGFEVTMNCPNNRYVNDEKICQAVTSMLAKVGVKVDLLAEPKAKYFSKLLAAGDYSTSFYLLGWTPGTMDVHNVLSSIMSCRGEGSTKGQFNAGNYCNPRIAEIADLVVEETDQVKRKALVDEALSTMKKEIGFIPLHQQPLSWGARDGIKLVQRADDVLDLRTIVLP